MSPAGKSSFVLATGYHARAKPLWEGRVKAASLDLQVIPFRNDGERHDRFVDGEFDGAEFSLALYLALKSRGAPFTAIPVFPNRRFRHSYIFVRKNSPLREPKDFRGKNVGIPSYLNTCGLWVRGVLGDEYDVRVQDVSWKARRPDPVQIVPPAGAKIELLPGNGDLPSRLLRGEIDAIITPEIPEAEGIERLIANAKEVEKDYYRRTSIFPISHAIVIRQQRLEESPRIAEELFGAWNEAKRIALGDEEDPTYSNYAWIRDLWEEERAVFGADQWRYGIAGNEKVIEALIRYGAEQGIVEKKLAIPDLFHPL